MSATAFTRSRLDVGRYDDCLREGRDSVVARDEAPDVPAAVSDALTGDIAGVDRAIALWRAADLEISPILGRRGALAVLRRALALNRAAFDWLPAPEDIIDLDEADMRLREAFAHQRPCEGDAAARALSATFRDVLSSLVGAALARQLLQSLQAHRDHAAIECPRPT